MDNDERNNEFNREDSKNEKEKNDEELNAKNNTSEEEGVLIKIGQLENEVLKWKDQYLRKAAEFENYKRRAEVEQLNLIKYSAESFIIKLLPIVDDFERSLKHMEDSNEDDSIKKGIQLIYDKLMKTLEEQGVKKMDSVGKPFNVEYHHALMQRKVEGTPPHTVLEEIETGYMYKDRVIRHAKVIVNEDSMESTAAGRDENSENNSNQNSEE
jgi:molecular chaperone GrpE